MSVSAMQPASPQQNPKEAVSAEKAAAANASNPHGAGAAESKDAKTSSTAATVDGTSNPAAAAANPNATSASLYVGELDLLVTEAMLFELFNQIGPVASIRVCRDAVTRRSLGYAYINFHNMADAERAMEAFNYQLIKGKPCRIMWSQRDPSLRKGGSGNIFIKNLDKSIDNKALHDTFSAFGNILSCKVAVDEANESRGYGFVHYETGEAAESAIKHVNGMLLNDKKVFVGMHVPRRERDTKTEEAKRIFTNIYIKNLEESITETEIRELFAPFGTITSLALAYEDEADKTKSRGFGFLNFESHEAADRAVSELNGKELKGKAIFVGRAQKKSEREEELRRKFEQEKLERMNKFAGVNLYVKNLDDTVDDEMLRQEFAAYGTITSAKIMRDAREASRGFGFVCFSSPDEATKAVTEMNQRMVAGKPIYVALAQRKDQRRQHLEAQHTQRASAARVMQPPHSHQGPMGMPMPYAPHMYYTGPGMPGAPGMMGAAGAGQGAGGAQGGPQNGPRGGQVHHSNQQGGQQFPGMYPPQFAMQYANAAGGPGMNVQQQQQGAGPGGNRGGPASGSRGFPPANAAAAAAAAGGGFPPGMNVRGVNAQQQQQQGGAPMMGGPGGAGAYSNAGPAGARMIQRQRPGMPTQQGQQGQQQSAAQAQAQAQAQAAAAAQNQARRGNYKFTASARNQGTAGGNNNSNGTSGNVSGGAAVNGNNGASGGADGGEASLVSMLASMTMGEARQALGERLYPVVQSELDTRGKRELAGKITGMLLEMENADLLHLLEENVALKEKVNEALDVLDKHHAKMSQQAQVQQAQTKA